MKIKKLFLVSFVILALSFFNDNVVNAEELPSNGVASQSVINQPSNTLQKKSYYKSNPKIIQLKETTSLYKDRNLTVSSQKVKKGERFVITNLYDLNDGKKVLKTADNHYLNADTTLSKKIKGYQNPKQYLQVQGTQIKPYGKVGYELSRGYEGIKVWKVMHKVGTWSGTNYYNQATYNAVKNFQKRHHLRVTGNVDLKTWQKLGFSKKEWTAIDSYVAPLSVMPWQGRKAHVEAMIKQVYKYMGKPWLAGCSTSPSYGIDCSGLVMQGLYAAGINPAPVSSINHAHPGNEWNSRNLWADKRIKKVPYNKRRRGDLVFYYQPGTKTIWHVAIYLGDNKVIESWPPCVMVQPIVNNQRNIIAGIKRPFV